MAIAGLMAATLRRFFVVTAWLDEPINCSPLYSIFLWPSLSPTASRHRYIPAAAATATQTPLDTYFLILEDFAFLLMYGREHWSQILTIAQIMILGDSLWGPIQFRCQWHTYLYAMECRSQANRVYCMKSISTRRDTQVRLVLLFW